MLCLKEAFQSLYFHIWRDLQDTISYAKIKAIEATCCDFQFLGWDKIQVIWSQIFKNAKWLYLLA